MSAFQSHVLHTVCAVTLRHLCELPVAVKVVILACYLHQCIGRVEPRLLGRDFDFAGIDGGICCGRSLQGEITRNIYVQLIMDTSRDLPLHIHLGRLVLGNLAVA